MAPINETGRWLLGIRATGATKDRNKAETLQARLSTIIASHFSADKDVPRLGNIEGDGGLCIFTTSQETCQRLRDVLTTAFQPDELEYFGRPLAEIQPRRHKEGNGL